jgi:hypothetical protein
MIQTDCWQDDKVAYVISKYTNENSNYKRHLINEQGQPICMSHTRSFSLEYTIEQCNCKRCASILNRINRKLCPIH